MQLDLTKYTSKNKKFMDKIIMDCISSIYYNFNITNKDNDTVTIADIHNTIIKDTSSSTCEQCCGMTSSGVRCSRMSFKNGYCKTHYNKYSCLNYTKIDDSLVQDKTRIVIQDEEYFYKDNILYSFNSINDDFIKCGVIKDGKHILTNDPFELEMLLDEL